MTAPATGPLSPNKNEAVEPSMGMGANDRKGSSDCSLANPQSSIDMGSEAISKAGGTIKCGSGDRQLSK